MDSCWYTVVTGQLCQLHGHGNTSFLLHDESRAFLHPPPFSILMQGQQTARPHYMLACYAYAYVYAAQCKMCGVMGITKHTGTWRQAYSALAGLKTLRKHTFHSATHLGRPLLYTPSSSHAHCTALHGLFTSTRRDAVSVRRTAGAALLPPFLAAPAACLVRTPAAAARRAVHAAEQPLPLLLLPGGHELLRQAVLWLPGVRVVVCPPAGANMGAILRNMEPPSRTHLQFHAITAGSRRSRTSPAAAFPLLSSMLHFIAWRKG